MSNTVRRIDNADVSFGSVMKLLRDNIESELCIEMSEEPKNEDLEKELANYLFLKLTDFLDENYFQSLETLEYDDNRESDEFVTEGEISRDLANETLRADHGELDSESEDDGLRDVDVSLYLPSESTQNTNGKKKLTYEQEDKIIDYIKSKPGHGIKTLKQKFKILKSMSDSYIYALKRRAQNPTREQRRRKLTQLAEALHDRFSHVRDFDKNHVDDNDLEDWALIFAQDLGLTNFSASRSFILRWKQKHRIRSRKVTNFITKRQVRDREQKESDAKNFGEVIRRISKDELIEPRFILNADQTGVPYELARNRTLNTIGDKYIYCKVKSKASMMNSFTAMIVITADGSVWPKTLLCMKEPNGRFGDHVNATVYRPQNVELTCTRSGKFTSSTFEYWVDTILTHAIPDDEKSLMILDSWAPHKNIQNFSAIEGRNFELHIVPPGTTPLCQPLDVYFNRQFKDLMKYIHHKIRLRATEGGCLDRNAVICAVSLALFIMSAPRFKAMVRYAFIKSGLMEAPREPFVRPLEACRIVGPTECDSEYCSSYANFLCPWCEKTRCIFCMIGMDGRPHMKYCTIFQEFWRKTRL